MTVDQLREIWNANQTNTNITDQILFELSFRKTKAAKKLQGDIDPTAITSKPVSGSSAVASVPISPSFHQADSDLACRYEELRNTFTMRGSILARWGLTELIPSSLIPEVMRFWHERLSETPDEYGRTKQSLISDMIEIGIDRNELTGLEK